MAALPCPQGGPCQRVNVGGGGRWEYCMWLSFLGFLRVTVEGEGRQSLEVGQRPAGRAGTGEQDEAARVSWGEGFCFEPHTETVTPKGNLPRPGSPH